MTIDDRRVDRLLHPKHLGGFPDFGTRRASVWAPLPAWNQRPGATHLAEHVWADCLFGPTFVEPHPMFLETNAYTSDYGVCGWVEYLAENEDEVLRAFSARIRAARVMPDILERERKIVLTEYADAMQRDWTRLWTILENQMYIIAPNVLGTPEDIAAATETDAAVLFDRARECPISVYGDPVNSAPVSNLYAPKPHRNSLTRAEYRARDARLAENDLALGVLLYDRAVEPERHELLVRPEFKCVWTALSNGLDAPLYRELREKRGLVYGVWSSVLDTGEPTVMFSCKAPKLAEATEVARACVAAIVPETVFPEGFVRRVSDHLDYDQRARTPLQAATNAGFKAQSGLFRARDDDPFLRDALKHAGALAALREVVSATAILFTLEP